MCSSSFKQLAACRSSVFDAVCQAFIIVDPEFHTRPCGRVRHQHSYQLYHRGLWKLVAKRCLTAAKHNPSFREHHVQTTNRTKRLLALRPILVSISSLLSRGETTPHVARMNGARACQGEYRRTSKCVAQFTMQQTRCGVAVPNVIHRWRYHRHPICGR